IWRSTWARSASSSTWPARKGVMRAVWMPSNMGRLLVLFERPLAGEDGGGGAGHHDGRSLVGPADRELAAAQLDHDLAIDAIAQHRGDGGRAGAGAAGEGLARAPLPGPLLDPAAREDLDELDVDAVREGD